MKPSKEACILRKRLYANRPRVLCQASGAYLTRDGTMHAESYHAAFATAVKRRPPT